MRVGEFNDPCFFKALIVTALGATLLVRIETDGVCSVFFDLLFQLNPQRKTPVVFWAFCTHLTVWAPGIFAGHHRLLHLSRFMDRDGTKKVKNT